VLLNFFRPKRILQCWCMGFGVIVLLFLIGNDHLTQALVLPIWELPRSFGVGGHDIEFVPLIFVGGSLMYGIAAFLLWWLIASLRQR
jgi:hypothetical protein